MLSRFLVLLAVYLTVMLVGNMHFRSDDVRLTGQNARTLVAAMQVFIVSALLCAHAVFMFFINVVKTERTAFVLVSARNGSAVARSDSASCFSIQEDDEEAAAIDAQSQMSNDKLQADDKTEHENKCSETIEARSEILSDASQTISLAIVFDSSQNLDFYFLYVTFVGMVLWCTFVAFNFAMYDTNFVVTAGMVVGCVANMLSRECRCHVSTIEPQAGGKVRMLFYACISLLIVALGTVHWRQPVDMQRISAVNMYVPSFLSGAFWTGVSHEVAFAGVQNVSRGILYDTRRSLPTFLLLVTVSALLCSPETCERVFDYIGNLSRLAAVHLLLLEPLLIFLSLYVMIIALERKRCTDFGIVLVLVEGVYIAYHREKYDAAIIATIAASVLLFAAHASHLLRAPK
jgi:hypothetical protein